MHTVLVVFSTSVRIKTVNFGTSLRMQVGDSSFELNNIQDQVEVCDIMMDEYELKTHLFRE